MGSSISGDSRINSSVGTDDDDTGGAIDRVIKIYEKISNLQNRRM